MKKKMAEIVKDEGITSAHVVYLMALKLEDGQTLTQISRFLDLDQANTHRVVKVLLEKKLIYDDRRTPTSKKFKIMLTNRGREIAEMCMKATEEHMDSYFEGIDDADVFHMRNTLIKMLKNMDKDLDKYLSSPKWRDPYYIYLGFIPPEEESEYREITESRRLREKK